MNVNPGELNKRIEIKKVSKKDGSAILVRSAWAGIKNTTSSEIKRYGIELADAKTRFIIRYSKTEINTDMKIYYNGKIYNIVYINNYYDSNEYLEILAECKGQTYES